MASDSEEDERDGGRRAKHNRRQRGGLAGNSTMDAGDFQFLDDLFHCTTGKSWDVDRGWDRRKTNPAGCYGVTVDALDDAATEAGAVHRLVALDLRGNNLKWLNEYPCLTAGERHVVLGLQAAAAEGLSKRERKLAAEGKAAEQKILPEGFLPESLGACTALQRLDLRRNRLRGALPLALGKLRALTHLNLYANCMSGSIPAAIGECRMLVELRLNQNVLTGEIPSTLSNCARLERLYLASNKLHGAIPRSVCTLLRLEHLDLRDNDLSGEIPDELGDLRLLAQLGLSGNKDLVIPSTGGAAHKMSKAMLKALEKAKEMHMFVGDDAYDEGETKPLALDDADKVLEHFGPILKEKRRRKDSRFCTIS
jgi:hypothetical protein